MDFETLQLEYTKLQETLTNTNNELKQFKENYQGLTTEKQKLSDEISRLKTINYDLFERVNTQYVKDTEKVESQKEVVEPLEQTKTLEQIAQEMCK